MVVGGKTYPYWFEVAKRYSYALLFDFNKSKFDFNP